MFNSIRVPKTVKSDRHGSTMYMNTALVCRDGCQACGGVGERVNSSKSTTGHVGTRVKED